MQTLAYSSFGLIVCCLAVFNNIIIHQVSCQRYKVQSIFDPNLECSPEGAEITRANVYFRCHNKTLKASGCLGHDKIRVPINETYKAFGNFDMLCKPVSEYWAQLVPLACWFNNKQYSPGEKFVDGHFWYTCEKTEYSVESKLSGCLGENNEKVLPNESYKRGDFIYTCTPREDSGINVEPVACVFNGVTAKVGQNVKNSQFMFTCTLENNYIRLTPSGCVLNNETIPLDQQFRKDGFVYQCKKTGNSIGQTIVGCLHNETGKAYSIGQKWIDGRAPYKFVTECVRLPSGYVHKRSIQCAVDHADGRAIIDPGCMRRVGKQLVQCYSPDFGSIGYTIRNLDEAMVEQKAIAAGLKYC